MAGPAPSARPRLRASGRRVAIVASRFHEDISERLVAGARAALTGHGVRASDVRVVWVPGAFELPQVAERLAAAGGVDALVCVGCVIRGETPHFDYVAGEAARGIAGGAVGKRGEEAALAALELLTLFADLPRSTRRRAPVPRKR